MGKRNFADFSESPYTPHDRSQSLQLTRLFQKFEYGVMTLSKALKVARGFERQKLGRREKTAQKEEGEKKEGTLSRIAEEIQVVKTLDPHTTAEKYLFKQLLKTKRIAESPLFIAFKDKKKIAAEGPKSSAEANVTARLYKSTPVKNVFPGIMEGIRKLLGIEDKPAGGDVKGADKKAKDGKTKEKSTKEDKKKSKDDSEAVSTKRASASADPDASPSGDEDINMDDAGSDADSIDFAQFDARLAPDSGDEDEDESEDDGRARNDISDGISDEEEEEEDDDQHISISRSPSPDAPPTKKAKGSKASSTPATSTTFLPSLTMGGYWSGSEDEAEDGEAANEPPRRKNRMGQQARRALWEKKYGSGANHVKQEKNKRKAGGRDNGWDARRGATDGGDRWGRGGGRGRPQQQQQFGRPQRGGPPAKKPEDNKPLHPSWEAARKAKEQKATAAFQGKKVTFD
ncbi:hypothetical protein AnigIFM63309_007605 [Aspergillus niger]|nr:hypothetical protein AnigIFM63309_007605 [Aspergillus niger]